MSGNGAAEPPWVKNRIAPEGTDGLYSQTWYPVCRSSDLQPGQIIGKEFLDGRIIVWRGYGGEAHVMSAYCVHLGTDMASGKVVGNNIQCKFHEWEYDCTGACAKTGNGDKVPPGASLFDFPVLEEFGLIWAFNGTEPLWQFPELRHSYDELYFLVEGPWEFPVDPWMIAGNTYDFQHIEILHGFTLEGAYPDEEIEWGDYSIRYQCKFTNGFGNRGEFTYGTLGNNIFFAEGELDGDYYAYLAPRAMPRAGHSDIYFTLMTHKGKGDPEKEAAARALARRVADIETAVAQQDVAILESIKFRQGYLTAADKQTSRFFKYARNYPRAHPSAHYI